MIICNYCHQQESVYYFHLPSNCNLLGKRNCSLCEQHYEILFTKLYKYHFLKYLITEKEYVNILQCEIL